MAERLAQHLISRGLLPASKVDAALKAWNTAKGALDTALLEQGLVSETGVLQALADVSGLQPVNLADFEPNSEATAHLPRKIAERLGVAPLSVDGGILHLAVSYPPQKEALKEVSFLLGKRLELWVAVECRIQDWNANVYGSALAVRHEALLRQLDPSRRARTGASAAVTAVPSAEFLSPEVRERVASGVYEEPILLSRPKAKRRPTLEVVAEEAAAGVPEDTVFIQADKYEVLAKEKHRTDEDDGREETSVLDLDKYADFARKATAGAASDPNLPRVSGPPPPAVAPAGEGDWDDTTAPGEPDAISFPGGVLPPSKQRRGSDAKPAAPRPVERLTVVPPRPRILVTRAQPVRVDSASEVTVRGVPVVQPHAAPTPPAPETLEPPALRRTASSEETDFSDLGRAVSQAAPSAPPRPESPSEDAPPADAAWQVSAPSWTPEAAADDSAAWPQTPSPEDWASLSPEEQAAWWAQYNAAYAQTYLADQAAEGFSGEQWVASPPAGEGEEAAAQPAPEPVSHLPEDFAPEPDVTAPLPPAADTEAGAAPGTLQVGASAAGLLPPEPDAWVAVPPWERPLAGSSAPPMPMPPEPVAPPPSAPPRIPSSPSEWTLPIARAALKGATQDRELLLEVALTFAQRAFEFAAAFAVVRGVAVGWMARGEGETETIRQVAIPLDAASVFRTVALTRGSYIGPMPPDALTGHYLGLLGRAPRTLLVWPLEVKGRLVAILYGDSGSKPTSQRRLSDFLLFCNELPAAFHELLVFRKQRTGARAAFSPAESGDTRPAALDEAATAVDAPVVADPEAEAAAVGDLLELLVGPDAGDRAVALAELLKTPEASARALAQAFPGPTAWSRLPVVELPEADELGPIPGALARLGRAGAVALAPLLDSHDSDQRYLALLTAGALRHTELVDGVVRGLFDVEPDISSAARAAAAQFKGVLRFDAQVPELRRELIARDPLNRSLAARALGALLDRGAVVGLIDLVDDPDELCAQSALESLREITRRNFAGDRDAWQVWWELAKDKRRIEWLVEALSLDDFDARLAAIDELTRASGENLGYFADGDEAERAMAAQRWAELIANRPELEV